MLGNLFGKKEEKDYLFKHLAFVNGNAKREALLKEAAENENALFIAWFSETATSCKNFFKENGIDPARVVSAHEVHSHQLEQHNPVFIEHYPLHEKEKQLAEGWNRMNIPVYSSLDEPLFKHMGADKVIPFLGFLGIKASEAIQHPMVSKSILNGQEKIAQKVVVDQPATSQSEWIEKNLLDHAG